MKPVIAILSMALWAVMAAPAGAALSPEDDAAVARVENYLNSIKSVQSDFVQVSSGGGFAEGKFYLKRPDKLRLDYAPPAKIQVYAGSWLLIYVDKEMQEVTQVPVSETLAGFLVRKKFELSGDITVTRVERSGGSLHLHMIKTEEPEAGRIVLTFATEPMQLRQWTVTDAQGVETKISLVNPEYGAEIPNKFFWFDPTMFESAPDY